MSVHIPDKETKFDLWRSALRRKNTGRVVLRIK